MSSSDTLRIPAFVGGIPTKADFAPSVLFSVLYGLLLIPILYRLSKRTSRTYVLLLFGTIPFAIERIVIYAIRASQSYTPDSADWLDRGGNKGRLVYQQISFSLGFFGFATDSVPIFRCLLVNTTLEDEERGSKDRPRHRFWFRRFSEVYGFVYLAASIPGILAGARYSKGTRDQDTADTAYRLRYASSALVLVFMAAFITAIQTARRRVQYMDKKAANYITVIILVTAIVPIYRLAVMHTTTSSVNPLPPNFTTYPPGNLSTSKDKALFYIFHALPEWIATALLTAVNLRKLLNTGPWGDWRGSDKAGIPVLRKDGMLPTDEFGQEVPDGKKPKKSEDGERMVGNNVDLEAVAPAAERVHEPQTENTNSGTTVGYPPSR